MLSQKEKIEIKWTNSVNRESATIKNVQDANLYKGLLGRTLSQYAQQLEDKLKDFEDIYGARSSEKILKRIVHELSEFYENKLTLNLNFDNYKEHPAYFLSFFDVLSINDKNFVQLTKYSTPLISEYLFYTKANKLSVTNAKDLVEKAKIYTFDK